VRRTTPRSKRPRVRREPTPGYGAEFGLEFLDIPFPPDPDVPFAKMTDREILLDTAHRVIALNHWHIPVNRALVALHVQDQQSTTDRADNRQVMDETRHALEQLTAQTRRSDFRQKLLTAGIGVGGAVASAAAGFALHHFFG
jgi:hypothetical protein